VKILLLLNANLIVFYVFGVTMFIVFRDDVWHYGSNVYHLSKYIGVSIQTSTGIAIHAEMFFITNLWGVFIAAVYINILVFQCINLSFKQLLTSSEVTSRTQLYSKLLAYQQLRILIALFNNTFGFYYIPYITTAFGLMFIIGMFMVVKLTFLKSFIVVALGGISIVFCGIFISLLTALAGSVHSSSRKFLRNLKSQQHKGNFSKCVMKAVKIMAVKSGCLYEIHMETSLTLLGLLVNISGSLMLSVSVRQ